MIRGAALHTLAGAYALNALGDPEHARFERHLAHCDACIQEVDGLRETAALLGSAVATRPPERLRDAVLVAAERTRQNPPVPQPEWSRQSPGPAPGWAALRWPAWRRRAWHRPERRRARRWGVPRWAVRWPGIALGATAASLACVVALAVVTVAAQHRLQVAERRNREVAAVLTAHDAKIMTAPVTTGGTATLVMSHSKRMIVFSAAGLRPLPGAMSYELWLMGPAGVRAAGMLPRPNHGMTAPMVASGLAPGDKIGLTVEPGAGSARPTTPPVLMVPLPR
ncbi:MAG: anti-sigma factor domain-containing protein [Micromonosporaceae bacterium]